MPLKILCALKCTHTRRIYSQVHGTRFNHATFVYNTLQFFIVNIELLMTAMSSSTTTNYILSDLQILITHTAFCCFFLYSADASQEMFMILLSILLERRCFCVFLSSPSSPSSSLIPHLLIVSSK